MEKEKFIILVGDGMADYALPGLDGRTPLEVAKTPHMDRIAACRIGRVKTIPDHMEPGSDVANLSLLGYDPDIYHTGRSPLEAASMGISLLPGEVAFRMNLVCLERKSPQEIIMLSHSSGDISTEEGKEIVETLQSDSAFSEVRIYPGVAYRHLLLWNKGPEKEKTIPPHDVLDQNMASYLALAEEKPIQNLISRSWEILENHPVNLKRRSQGQLEANSIWLWGQGRAPSLPSFAEKFGLTGGVISAVDLLKGIGAYAGLVPIQVEGATGYLDTNYVGKAEEALKGLETMDFMFVHVEAPDEASHNASVKDKIQAIEDFDAKVVGTVLEGLSRFEDARVMVVSDHYTPIPIKTHSADPPPFAWATLRELQNATRSGAFTEQNAIDSGLLFEKGHELIAAFLGR